MSTTEGIEEIGRQLTQTLQIVFGIFLGLAGFFAIGFAIWVGFKLASAEDEGKRKEAKKQLLWSIIAVVAVIVLAVIIFVMIEVLIDDVLPEVPNMYRHLSCTCGPAGASNTTPCACGDHCFAQPPGEGVENPRQPGCRT